MTPHRSPTTLFLYRARLIFMLASLVPTVLLTGIGVILVASGESRSLTIITGILVLAFGVTALAGYFFGTYFVTRGANLAAVQNEFLSSVSHEIRTPLTSILMFIETLREDRLSSPDERRRCLTIAHRELTRLDGLVGDLIRLSKMEAGRTVLARDPVQVADVVADALAAFEATRLGGEAQAHAEVHAHVQPGLTVFGNRAALAQALGNLLSNAWKFTAPNEKRIEVRAEGDSGTVSIAVSDNGLGVDRTEREAIFEKFERGSAAAAGGSGGSGLGLAIVHAIVDAHQGRIEVQSRADQGACFRIVLPRHRVAA